MLDGGLRLRLEPGPVDEKKEVWISRLLQGEEKKSCEGCFVYQLLKSGLVVTNILIDTTDALGWKEGCCRDGHLKRWWL